MSKEIHQRIEITRPRTVRTAGMLATGLEGGDEAMAASKVIRNTIQLAVECGAALEAIRFAAEWVIKTTADAGGDVGRAASGLLDGSIEGARELDLDAFELASTAAFAALKTAREISAKAGVQVLHALTGNMAGVPMALNSSYATN